MVTNKVSTKNDFENELKHSPICGLYHAWLVLTLLIPCGLVGANIGSLVFQTMIPKYNCKLPFLNNTTQLCGITITDDIITRINSLENNKCERYNFHHNITTNCSFWLSINTTSWKNISSNWISDVETEQCDDWLFDRSIMRNTIVTEFGLVCQSEWAGYIFKSIFMCGILTGNILSGYISDKFGRRKAFLISILGQFLFGVITSFAQTYWTFVLFRAFAAVFVCGFFPVFFTLVSELVSAKNRAAFQQMAQFNFSLGLMYLCLMAFVTKDWRTLQLTISIPAILGIPVWWFLPESPRWLFYKNRHEEVIRFTNKVHYLNSFNIFANKANETDPPNIVEETEMRDSAEESSAEDTNRPANTASFEHNVSALFRLPGLRMVSFVQFYQWFAVASVYYALTFNMAELGGDPFLNMLFAAILETFIGIAAIPILDKWGRIKTAAGAEIFAGLLCIAMPYIPSDITWLYIATSIIGRVFITLSFDAMFIQTSEIYPTAIRNTALGMCNVFGRVGGIVSPLIAMLSLLINNLAYIVFGIISILSGIIVLSQPETNKQPLTSTIEEGEDFVTSHSWSLLRLFKKN